MRDLPSPGLLDLVALLFTREQGRIVGDGLRAEGRWAVLRRLCLTGEERDDLGSDAVLRGLGAEPQGLGPVEELSAQRVLEAAEQHRQGIAVPSGQRRADSPHRPRAEASVLEERQGRLKVVVDRHDTRPISVEVHRRRLAVQVNQDSSDGVAALQLLDQTMNRDAAIVVDPGESEDLGEHGAIDPPREQIGIQRVDEGVALGVVPEQRLLALPGRLDAGGEQGRQLVADLLLERLEAELQEVAEVVLEDEPIEVNAVEAQLLGEHAPHLLRGAAEEVDEGVACGGHAELAQELRAAGDVLLLGGPLKGRPNERGEAVKVRVEVSLVEVPAVDVRCGQGHPGPGRAHLRLSSTLRGIREAAPQSRHRGRSYAPCEPP